MPRYIMKISMSSLNIFEYLVKQRRFPEGSNAASQHVNNDLTYFRRLGVKAGGARNYRPSFRENKPKTLVFND
jgi:hypothetical protein